MNRFEHVRLKPEMYGLQGNFFRGIFDSIILEMLATTSFTHLSFDVCEAKNKIIFEASERKYFQDICSYCCYTRQCTKPDMRKRTLCSIYYLFLIIGGISRYAEFFVEYKDGSCDKMTTKDTVADDTTLLSKNSKSMTRFHCVFILPENHPVDENFARGKIHKFSRIFPHCNITYNGQEYLFSEIENRNRITWFLHHRQFDQNAAKIFEFNGTGENYSWEVSFSFGGNGETTSFINGYETGRGGVHAEMIKKSIRQVFQQISGEKNIYLKKFHMALSIHIFPYEEIAFTPCFNCRAEEKKLISYHPEFNIIAKEFKQQITAYFQKHQNDFYKVLAYHK